MAVIHDVMPAFELFQPASISEAVTLLSRHGSNAWVMAGGMDSLRLAEGPNQTPGYRGRSEPDRGLCAASRSRTADLKSVPRRRSPKSRAIPSFATSSRLLMEAAELVASPQIRNQGTIGGNISQDTRCWYYRAGWTCYRAGGNICYADTPTAINREHAILDADRCVAVNPSDTAPALVALDAQMVIQSARGRAHRPAPRITSSARRPTSPA